MKLTSLLLALLMLFCALPAMAEEAQEAGHSIVITPDMQLRGGPGMEYGQASFFNYPPVVGEEAEVLGRCGDWLLVSYQGQWYSQRKPVWAYLPSSFAPEYANLPEMAFDPRPNALGVESSQLYVDPSATTTNTWIPYDENGLTVLSVYGEMAYVDAVNAYGNPVRGFVFTGDLAVDPTMPELPNAPEGTAVRTAEAMPALKYAPAFSAVDAIDLEGGWALLYDTDRGSGRYAVVTAVVDGTGKALNSHLLRTWDGTEDNTLEFMLPTRSGYVVNRFDGSEDNTASQTIFTFTGKKKGTDTRRYKAGQPYDSLGTTRYRVAVGAIIDAEEAGRDSRPLEIRLLQGNGTCTLEIPLDAFIPQVLQGDFGLLIPLVPSDTEEVTRLMIFDASAALAAEGMLPFRALEVQMVPLNNGHAFLLARDEDFVWHSFTLDPANGEIVPGSIALPVSYNRDVALLAADGERALIAVGGRSTQLLLVDDESRLLAAATPGSLIHADSDGRTAQLLLLQNGTLRLETYDLRLP